MRKIIVVLACIAVIGISGIIIGTCFNSEKEYITSDLTGDWICSKENSCNNYDIKLVITQEKGTLYFDRDMTSDTATVGTSHLTGSAIITNPYEAYADYSYGVYCKFSDYLVEYFPRNNRWNIYQQEGSEISNLPWAYQNVKDDIPNSFADTDNVTYKLYSPADNVLGYKDILVKTTEALPNFRFSEYYALNSSGKMQCIFAMGNHYETGEVEEPTFWADPDNNGKKELYSIAGEMLPNMAQTTLYIKDIDNDGQIEVITNYVFDLDGHQEAFVYDNFNGRTMVGQLSRSQFPNHYDWGVNSVGTEYDIDSESFKVSYCRADKIYDTDAETLERATVSEIYIPDDKAIYEWMTLKEQWNMNDYLVLSFKDSVAVDSSQIQHSIIDSYKGYRAICEEIELVPGHIIKYYYGFPDGQKKLLDVVDLTKEEANE